MDIEVVRREQINNQRVEVVRIPEVDGREYVRVFDNETSRWIYVGHRGAKLFKHSYRLPKAIETFVRKNYFDKGGFVAMGEEEQATFARDLAKLVVETIYASDR